jgi:hypothetical protein
MARTTLKTPFLLELLCNLATTCSMDHWEHSSYCCVFAGKCRQSLPSNGHIRHNILNNYFESCVLKISEYEAFYSVIRFYCILYSAYWLTPWSWGLLEKPPVTQLLKNFPAFSQIRGFTTCSAWCLLHARFLLGLLFHPEDWGNIILRNVGWTSTDCTALHPRR